MQWHLSNMNVIQRILKAICKIKKLAYSEIDEWRWSNPHLAPMMLRILIHHQDDINVPTTSNPSPIFFKYCLCLTIVDIDKSFWNSAQHMAIMNFKKQLGCRFDIMDNESYFFVFWHMQLYMSWYIRSFFGFTFLNILYFFKYSCTNIFHKRSLYTFYEAMLSMKMFG